MAVLTSTGVTFGDGTTQASGSTLGSIGTYILAYSSYSPNANGFAANTTLSGSYLFLETSATTRYQGVPQGNRVNATSSFTTATSYGGSHTFTNYSGTWRLLAGGLASPTYDPCAGYTNWTTGLFVRVS